MTKLKIIILIIVLFSVHPTYRWYMEKKSYEYFQQRCEQDAGEFIYRTVENVKGVYQVRPRDPEDYFSRLRKGDIPEDPYGHTNMEARRPVGLFLTAHLSHIPSSIPYDFFETRLEPFRTRMSMPSINLDAEVSDIGAEFWQYRLVPRDKTKKLLYSAVNRSFLESEYSFSWREVRDENDIKHGVWGGELTVNAIDTNETLGVRRGFFFRNRYSGYMEICPRDKNSLTTYSFVSKILKPPTDKNHQ